VGLPLTQPARAVRGISLSLPQIPSPSPAVTAQAFPVVYLPEE